MLLGYGANGVVITVSGPDNEQHVIKYWNPWTARLSFLGRAPPEAVDRFLRQLNGRPGIQAMKHGTRVKIRAFGDSFPLQYVYARLIENKLRRRLMPVTRDQKAPRCSKYTIANGIPMKVLKDFTVRMPRAGPTLYREMPIMLDDAFDLLRVLASAAASALIQGFAIADQKPLNVCRPPQSMTGWVVIDIDNLPRTLERTEEHATYAVDEAKTAAEASIASLVITMILAVGVDHVTVDNLFAHDRPKRGDCAKLRELMDPVDPRLVALISPLLGELEKNFSVASATEALIAAATSAKRRP